MHLILTGSKHTHYICGIQEYIVNVLIFNVFNYRPSTHLLQEKFSDVVNWLKANALKRESSSAAGSTAQKKLMPEINNNEIKSLPGFSGFAPVPMTATFATSWSSGSFNNNKAPFLFGRFH